MQIFISSSLTIQSLFSKLRFTRILKSSTTRGYPPLSPQEVGNGVGRIFCIKHISAQTFIKTNKLNISLRGMANAISWNTNCVVIGGMMHIITKYYEGQAH